MVQNHTYTTLLLTFLFLYFAYITLYTSHLHISRDGFLDLRLPIWSRALLTRLVAMVPCMVLAVAYPDGTSLNMMINFVNSSLAFLLPFALTPF
mmetsp:Transcript_49606/g.50436  ORF Transcript_49606/g.50436 Transcript_49606/m.50436 type:complete len:94 (-) Transcript_49606:403-684(-)